MVIEKIVVIAVAMIGVIYLSLNFIMKKKVINLFVIAVQTFFIGLYIAANIYRIVVPLYVEGLIFGFGIVFPFLVCLLEASGLKIFGGIKSLNGYMLFKMGKYDKAVEGLTKSYNKNPDNIKMLKALAETQKQLKDYQSARDVYSKLIELDKDDYNAYYNLGYIFELQNKKDSAKMMYLQCLRIKPEHIDSLEAMSFLECELTNYDEALKYCDKILSINPKKYEAMFNKAVIYTTIGELEEALMCYEKALDENPKLYEAEYNIGQLAYIKGDYERAEKAFKNATHSDVYKVKAKYFLAKIYAIFKERKKAIENLEYAMTNNPDLIMEAREDLVFQELHDYIESYIVDQINSTTSSVNMSADASREDLENSRRNYGIFNK